MSRLADIKVEVRALEDSVALAQEKIRGLKLEAGELALAGDTAVAVPATAKKKRPKVTAESPTDEKVLRFLAASPSDSHDAADIATGIGSAESTVRQSLGKLWKLARVEKPGQGQYRHKG